MMSIKKEPASSFNFSPESKEASRFVIGIAVAEWNPDVTGKLLEACRESLLKHGIAEENILIQHVPGSYELPLAAQWFFEYKNADAVCCLGCIIKGETPHFHFISDYTANAIGEVSLKYNRPVAFGVITAETDHHATDRAGGSKGNKGEEAAMAVLKMIMAKEELRKRPTSSVGFA